MDRVTTGTPARSGTVWQQVDTWRDQTEAVLEASLPRFAHGDNSVSVSIPHVHDLVARLHADAAHVLDWECEPRDSALMRLDLVRDFSAVDDGPRHLRALSDVPAVRATTHAITLSGSAQVQTLYRKTTRWKARLYLRDAPPLAAPVIEPRLATRSLRYELELKSKVLRDLGIKRVDDLTSVLTEAIARDYFQRCRFDVPVGSVLAKGKLIHDQFARAGNLRDARAILGQVWSDFCADPDLDSGDTAKKWRKQALDRGLAPSELATHAASGALRRLDFDSGVLAAA